MPNRDPPEQYELQELIEVVEKAGQADSYDRNYRVLGITQVNRHNPSVQLR
jgi:hypothetical protein